MNTGQRILWCNSCHFNISMLAQLNDCIGGLLHLGPNVITFRALLHLGPNVITSRTLLRLGQLLHLGLQQTLPVKPVHSISKRGVIATKIQAIEIWVVTPTVPPGSFELDGAVVTPMIATILISRSEWHTVMHSKRVTRTSWKHEPHYEY